MHPVQTADDNSAEMKLTPLKQKSPIYDSATGQKSAEASSVLSAGLKLISAGLAGDPEAVRVRFRSDSSLRSRSSSRNRISE